MSDVLDMLRKSAKMTKTLSAEEELKLAIAWRDQQDVKALHKLTRSFIGFAMSQAKKYGSYRIPLEDLTQQACIGVMKATKGYDPDKGFRFSTFARHWIGAELRDYALKQNSVVTGSTSNNQKKLFFHMGKAKRKIERKAWLAGKHMSAEEVRIALSKELDISYEEVIWAEGYASLDKSLDAPLKKDDEEGMTGIDALEDTSASVEDLVEKNNFQEYISKSLRAALQELNDREKHIIQMRRLSEDPMTLEDLSKIYNVSRERVRQIEVRSMEKIEQYLRQKTKVPELVA